MNARARACKNQYFSIQANETIQLKCLSRWAIDESSKYWAMRFFIRPNIMYFDIQRCTKCKLGKRLRSQRCQFIVTSEFIFNDANNNHKINSAAEWMKRSVRPLRKGNEAFSSFCMNWMCFDAIQNENGKMHNRLIRQICCFGSAKKELRMHWHYGCVAIKCTQNVCYVRDDDVEIYARGWIKQVTHTWKFLISCFIINFWWIESRNKESKSVWRVCVVSSLPLNRSIEVWLHDSKHADNRTQINNWFFFCLCIERSH